MSPYEAMELHKRLVGSLPMEWSVDWRPHITVTVKCKDRTEELRAYEAERAMLAMFGDQFVFTFEIERPGRGIEGP